MLSTKKKKEKEKKEKKRNQKKGAIFIQMIRSLMLSTKNKRKRKRGSPRKYETKSVKTRFSYKSGEISINILDVEHLQFMQIVTTANPSMLCLANEARIGPGSARPFILKSHETGEVMGLR